MKTKKNCLADGTHSNHQRLLIDDINKEYREIKIFCTIMDNYKQKIRDINTKKRKQLLESLEMNKNKIKEINNSIFFEY